MRVDVRPRCLDLGLPPYATDAYGTTIVGAPSRRAFFFTYVDPPSAYRLVRFDLDTGEPHVLKGVNGELLGGVFDARKARLHALLSHGLYEVCFEPFTIQRKLRRGIPKFAHSVTLVGDDALAVRAIGRQSCGRVTLADYAVAGRYRIPGIDAAFGVDGQQMVFAFGHGLECKLGADGRTIGRPGETPRLLSPVATTGAVFGIATRKAAPAPGRADPATPNGAVVRLDRATRRVVARRPLAKVRRLLGIDGAGRVVAVTHRELVLLEPGTLTVVARRAVGHEIVHSALAGPGTVVTAARKRENRELTALEWGEDLSRGTPKTKRVEPTRVPHEVSDGKRTVHVNQQYSGHRIEPKPPYEDKGKEQVEEGGRDFRGCALSSCTINCLFSGQRAHYLVRDVHLDRCRIAKCSATNVAFEECLLERSKVSGMITLTGCVFKHVTIRGAAGFMCLYDYHERDLPKKQRRLRHGEIEAYYRGVDWALDVREADTENMRIHNVPVELVRRDPRRTLLVWTKDADDPVWQSEALDACTWRQDVADAVGTGRRAVLLSVTQSARYQKRYAAAERALRKAGLVDDVTGTG